MLVVDHQIVYPWSEPLFPHVPPALPPPTTYTEVHTNIFILCYCFSMGKCMKSPVLFVIYFISLGSIFYAFYIFLLVVNCGFCFFVFLLWEDFSSCLSNFFIYYSFCSLGLYSICHLSCNNFPLKVIFPTLNFSLFSL